MSLGFLLTVACAWIIWKDRGDWFNYVIIGLAFMYFASTDIGSGILPKLTELSAWADVTITGWFS